MKSLKTLFDNNRDWADSMRASDPEFFSRLESQQHPEYLWIGCSDSRVPANQVTGLMPGEVFVHRNIANVVVPTDLNLLSVVQYAVDALKVKHVIVCGHYNCGGVKAALGSEKNGLVDNWLRHIKSIAKDKEEDLKQLSPKDQLDRMCEWNVIQQAKNLSRTTVMQDAWDRGQEVEIHSWIYSLADGRLQSLSDPILGVS